MTRIVFLGTPAAAVPTLHALNERHDVVAVITMPDRPRGRSAKPQPPAVKVTAESLGLEVLQPASSAETSSLLADLGPIDVGVVVAFGQILQPAALATPAHGMLNVHFSLLPRWRGAAPVARALMSGDPMSGVTIIQIDEGLDTGPVLTAQAVDIRADDDAGSLTERLAELGARLMADSVEDYVDGELVPVEQSDQGLTYARKIEKSDRRLSADSNVEDFVNRVRGLSPSPAATLVLDGESFKIFNAVPAAADIPPGRWMAREESLLIGLTGGVVEVRDLQPPGKRRMPAADFLRGLNRGEGDAG